MPTFLLSTSNAKMNGIVFDLKKLTVQGKDRHIF